MEAVAIDPALGEAIMKIEPGKDLNASVARMALRQVERELAIYEATDGNYRQQYGMGFEEFYDSEFMREPSFAVEQDYFDWELATSQLKRLRQEWTRLSRLAL